MKKLSDYGLNTGNRVYIIAEIGINHGGDPDKGKRLIEAAAKSGVDAVKFQTYLTEKRVQDEKSDIYGILKNCELPFEAFSELKRCAEDNGVTFFSTPFDEESLAYLESIGAPLYKIASFDIVNKKLLKAVAFTGKPVLISTGMATFDEVKEGVSIFADSGSKVSLLHCVSSYPLNYRDANLEVIRFLLSKFDFPIGFSGHSDGIEIPLYAVAAGAQIIEKHFKLSDDDECADAPVSVTPALMKELVRKVRLLEDIMGTDFMGVRDAERGITPFRRKSDI